jgi:hypothetical protein
MRRPGEEPAKDVRTVGRCGAVTVVGRLLAFVLVGPAGTGGGSCNVITTLATYSSGWIYPASNSYGSHTVSRVIADAGTVGYMNSITNRLEARWTNGSRSFDDSIELYHT